MRLNGYLDRLVIVMFQQRAKVFGIACLATVGSLNSIDLAAFSNRAIDAHADVMHLTETLNAKKSGGRSGGGSFNRKSSGSSKSRSSDSSSRESNSYSTDDSNTVPSDYGSPDGQMGLIILSLMLSVFSVGLLIIFVSEKLGINHRRNYRKIGKIHEERDNDRVAVSLLQIALSPAAIEIQEDLSLLSLDADTNTELGLVTLMRESALTLLRHEIAWTHVLSSSNSLNIEEAESAFERLSIIERSKFSGETLSNIDGVLKTRSAEHNTEDNADYVVVTLILGTADDDPLFDKIRTVKALREELLKIASMRDDYLFRFELLWTPQQAEQYLTDEELLLEYRDIVPLA